jgi:hypothetical protein
MRLRESFSRGEIAFIVGVPLAWGVLLLFHPNTGDSLYELASSDTTAWLVVHLGTLVFIPLLAAVLFLVLTRFEGTAALISRIALAFFVVFYGAFEILVGIGTGLLVDTGAPEDVVTAYAAASALDVIETVGSLAWLVAVAAAGVAMYNRAHRATSIAVVVLFVISAPGIVIHVTPVGPAGLVLFVLALWLLSRETVPAPVAKEPLVAA